MDPHSSVKISYLVAVRNRVSTIGRCLSSMVSQNVDELVVIDGKSTDGTSDIIETFPVLWLQDTGVGLAKARNLAFERCTGDYVVIIDGDQWISKDFNANLRKILNNREYDVVFCKEIWKGSSIWAQAHQKAWVQASNIRWDRIYRPRIIRSSILQKIGGWDEHFTSFEDADLWERIKKIQPRMCKSKLLIYSDASNMSVVSEFKRGIWYGSRVTLFVRTHPSQCEELTSIAPLDFVVDLLLVARILAANREFKIAFAALALRISRSMGWLLGVLTPF